MKRQLDEQERKATEKGVKVIMERVDRLKESLQFNELTINFQKTQDEYQEAVKPYIRKRKREEDEKIMKSLTQSLVMEMDNVKELQDQLLNGVKVKEVKK